MNLEQEAKQAVENLFRKQQEVDYYLRQALEAIEHLKRLLQEEQ